MARRFAASGPAAPRGRVPRRLPDGPWPSGSKQALSRPVAGPAQSDHEPEPGPAIRSQGPRSGAYPVKFGAQGRVRAGQKPSRPKAAAWRCGTAAKRTSTPALSSTPPRRSAGRIARYRIAGTRRRNPAKRLPPPPPKPIFLTTIRRRCMLTNTPRIGPAVMSRLCCDSWQSGANRGGGTHHRRRVQRRRAFPHT